MNLVYKDSIHVEISFSFNHSALFFNDLKCDFPENSLTFIIGRNGIGKSTLLRILQGKIHKGEMIQGTIISDGITYNFDDKNTKALLANLTRLVLQNYSNMLALDFSVATNLGAAQLSYYPHLNALPASFKYADMLQEIGITLDKYVSQLSGGQRQILAIVMALQKPIKLLLLDEPTAALDEANARMVMDFLTKLARLYKIIIVCISHDRELIRIYGQNLYYEIVKNNKNERYIEKRQKI